MQTRNRAWTIEDLLWGTDLPPYADALEEFVNEAQHRLIASSQLSTTDTMAELWYQNGSTPDTQAVVHTLRNTESEYPLCDTTIDLAKRLQYSILNSPLMEPCVVYRGIESRPHGATRQILKTISIGSTIMSDGFWSTTTNPKVASDFASTDNIEAIPVMFRIQTSLGKFLLTSSGEGSSKYFYREYEVVLPHNGELLVVGIDELPLDEETTFPCILVSLVCMGVSNHTGLNVLDISLKRQSVDPKASIKEAIREARISELMSNMLDTYKRSGLPFGGSGSSEMMEPTI